MKSKIILDEIKLMITSIPLGNYNINSCNIDSLISLVEEYRDLGGKWQTLYDLLTLLYNEASDKKWICREGCLDTLLECIEVNSGNPYKQILF